MAPERKPFRDFLTPAGLSTTQVRIALQSMKDWLEETGAGERQVELENLWTFKSSEQSAGWKQVQEKYCYFNSQKTSIVRRKKRVIDRSLTFGEPGTEIKVSYGEGGSQSYHWTITPSGGWTPTSMRVNNYQMDLSSFIENDFQVGWVGNADFKIRGSYTDAASQTRTPQVHLRTGHGSSWIPSRGLGVNNIGEWRLSEVTLWDHRAAALETLSWTDNPEPENPGGDLLTLEDAMPLLMYLHLRPYGPLGSNFPWRTGSKA